MNKRKLFPRYGEEKATLGIRLPLSILDEITRRAAAQVRSKSDIGRQMIMTALQHEGVIGTDSKVKEHGK